MSKIRMVFAVAVCAAVMVAPHAEGLDCRTVAENLAPCITYLRQGGAVPDTCCDGVRSLNAAAYAVANSTMARQQACRCMKSEANAYGVNPTYAAAIPKACNVTVGYPINLNVDCNTVR